MCVFAYNKISNSFNLLVQWSHQTEPSEYAQVKFTNAKQNVRTTNQAVLNKWHASIITETQRILAGGTAQEQDKDSKEIPRKTSIDPVQSNSPAKPSWLELSREDPPLAPAAHSSLLFEVL